MRGKLNGTLDWHLRWRNIPAYAGKTHDLYHIHRKEREHPRVCGENRLVRKEKSWLPGTSPRMRGKRLRNSEKTPEGRNIPAYAGKTFFCSSAFLLSEEHPRVCGENLRSHRLRQPKIGTSPRMRGKPFCLCLITSVYRNIPAYAGKTHRGLP